MDVTRSATSKAAELQHLAREAFRQKELLELPFRGGAPELFRLRADRSSAELIQSPSRRAIVDRYWAEQKGKHFDGSLVGVTSLRSLEHSLEGTYSVIRYRDYVAADQVLADPARIPTPLAIGVHCLLRREDHVAILRDSRGRALVPGGAVDLSAAIESAPSIERAIRNEILEEAGYQIGSDKLTVTRVYVGGYPTHIICMTVLDIADDVSWGALCHSGHRAEAEDIVSIEPVPLMRLIEASSTLPLMTRTALRAFTSWHQDIKAENSG